MPKPAELPEAWQSKATPKFIPVAGSVVIPERETDNPAELAAWFSGFSLFEMWRKVLLANCRELIRAQMALAEIKCTESRLDDLGHLHSSYVAYLMTHMEGRIAWEREYAKRGFGA